MLRLSTKGRYGTRLMVAFALGEDGAPMSLREVSERENISENYLWQVARPLRDAGLVRAVPGASGGYSLARAAERISLLEILVALEGDIALADCLQATEQCIKSTDCVTHAVWQELTDLLAERLKEITLSELVARQRDLEDRSAWNYVI